MDIYGSFATDLSIEGSDIDFTIYPSTKSTSETQSLDIEYATKKLCIEFKNQEFESINAILTATVPIIKLVTYFFIIIFNP